jgi:polyisoprenoid-binding protein YceI
MNNLWKSLFVALVLVGLCLPATYAETKTYDIDPTHSSVDFKIRHLGISWVRGSFGTFTGKVRIDEAKPENSSIEVTVEAASVNTNNEKRDGHLKSDDYFAVETHPSIVFKSTSVKKTGDNTYEVVGKLTLLGTTKPVTVTLTDSGEIEAQGKTRRGAEISDFKIVRSEYGMTEMVGPIGDEVHLYLAFSTIKE